MGYREINAEYSQLTELVRKRTKDTEGYMHFQDMPTIRTDANTISVNAGGWIALPPEIADMYKEAQDKLVEWATKEAEKRKKKLDAIDALLDE